MRIAAYRVLCGELLSLLNGDRVVAGFPPSPPGPEVVRDDDPRLGFESPEVGTGMGLGCSQPWSVTQCELKVKADSGTKESDPPAPRLDSQVQGGKAVSQLGH